MLACLWCGFALSVLYDVLRFARRRGGGLVSAVLDTFFALMAFAFTGVVLFAFDNGRLRLYSLPLIAAAFITWQLACSPVVRAALARIRLRLHRDRRPPKER